MIWESDVNVFGMSRMHARGRGSANWAARVHSLLTMRGEVRECCDVGHEGWVTGHRAGLGSSVFGVGSQDMFRLGDGSRFRRRGLAGLRPLRWVPPRYGARFIRAAYPALTRWAILCRRYAARASCGIVCVLRVASCGSLRVCARSVVCLLRVLRTQPFSRLGLLWRAASR